MLEEIQVETVAGRKHTVGALLHQEAGSGAYPPVAPMAVRVNRSCVPLCPVINQHPIIRSSTNKLLTLAFTSHAHPMASSSSSSSSNFQLIINNALDTYKKRTKNDLRAHPLASKLESCNTPSAILAVLQQQIQGLDQSRSSDDRWTRWLDPTVNVLFALSATLGEGVGLVCLTT